MRVGEGESVSTRSRKGLLPLLRFSHVLGYLPPTTTRTAGRSTSHAGHFCPSRADSPFAWRAYRGRSWPPAGSAGILRLKERRIPAIGDQQPAHALNRALHETALGNAHSCFRRHVAEVPMAILPRACEIDPVRAIALGRIENSHEMRPSKG